MCVDTLCAMSRLFVSSPACTVSRYLVSNRNAGLSRWIGQPKADA
jgi:hypothetical protein